MAERFLVPKMTLPEGAVIPENMKKKIERNTKLASDKKTAILKNRAANKVIRHNLKMKSLKYDKQYRVARNRLTAKRRVARSEGNFFVEPEAKLMFVIRITGINKLAPKPRKILQLLRLNQLHKGIFVKVTRPMLNMLKYIQPYIICGYPSLAVTRELIMKRGFAKMNKQRIPLTNNQTIQEGLGKYGIEGMDDLIHEIYTVGPHFKQASNFLWPFKLSSPKGGFVRKVHGFHELRGGDWGNREELINELIRRMN
eukprot:GEMP01039673.1.p1 GENE.GEMP01039673.1~~GEMP01039673.1.p1  ORF type:complete len:267 (-),score=64.19 GEMP01039673.1:1120-1884(-)